MRRYNHKIGHLNFHADSKSCVCLTDIKRQLYTPYFNNLRQKILYSLKKNCQSQGNSSYCDHVWPSSLTLYNLYINMMYAINRKPCVAKEYAMNEFSVNTKESLRGFDNASKVTEIFCFYNF